MNSNRGRKRSRSGSDSPRPRSDSDSEERRSRAPSGEWDAEDEAKWGSSSSSQPSPRLRQLTLPDMWATAHGRESFDQARRGSRLDKQRLYDTYRMKAQPHPFGGSGKDESVATSYMREHANALVNANVPGLDVKETVGKLSESRTNTDALVWHPDDAEIGSHPGALRSIPKTNHFVTKGHRRRDISRKKAIRTEFSTLVPTLTATTAAEVRKAETRSAIRADIETIRTMSQSAETFEAKGPPTDTIFHTRAGDISNPENFRRMAVYVHNTREDTKWKMAGRMLARSDLLAHVPEVMRDYLVASKGDHIAAKREFDERVAKGFETRVNNHPATQADALDPMETLSATAGRKRALSAPRRRYTR